MNRLSRWARQPHALARASTVLAALAAAWGLKAFYSGARFEQLAWVLEPSRRGVELLTGAVFVREPGSGFLCREARFEIVPACAGINFMIAAFVSLVLLRRTAVRRPLEGLWLLAGAAAAAYGATLLANSVRIALAMQVHAGAHALGPLGPERVQEAVGVATYVSALLALSAAATCAERERDERVA